MDPIKKIRDPLMHVAESRTARQAVSLAEEFRDFAFKGNVVDLAIGVIIGAAFGKVVDSLVKDVVMPFVALFLPGEEGYRSWKWIVNGREILYGQFLSELVNFLVVALVLFLFLFKFLGWLTSMRGKQGPPPPTKEQELLTEIRDLLRKQGPQQTT